MWIMAMPWALLSVISLAFFLFEERFCMVLEDIDGSRETFVLRCKLNKSISISLIHPSI